MALRSLPTRLKPIKQYTAPLQEKTAEPFYKSPEFRRWREQVRRNARGRCQWPGCSHSDATARMFADHIVERKDGGAPLDPSNGQYLCADHHNKKSAQERKRRLSQ